jgi:hypothetical protein
MTGSVPSLLTISAVVLTVQAAMVLATGELDLTVGRDRGSGPSTQNLAPA